MLNERDRKMRNVDSDPAPIQLMRGGNGRAAAAEGIKDNIPLVTASFDNPLQQSFGFLRRVSQTFLGLGINWRNVFPQVLNFVAWLLVEITFQADSAGFILRKIQPSLPVVLLHFLSAD